MLERNDFSGQDSVLKIMRALGYEPNKLGVCHGMAMMGLSAFLSGEMTGFTNRIEAINQLVCDLDNDSIIKHFDELKQNMVDKYRNAAQHNVTHKLTDEEQKQVDIIAFLDGVKLYCNPGDYEDLFQKKLGSRGDEESISDLVASNKIRENGGLRQVKSWLAIYAAEELESYLQILNSTAKESNTDLAIILSAFTPAGGHAISVCYDAAKNAWHFIDPNHSSVREFNSLSDLAANIKAAFLSMEDEALAFNARILTVGKKLDQQNAFVARLENLDAFKKITTPDIGKVGQNNQGYAFLATRYKDHAVIRELAQKGADFNEADDTGMTPLRLAIMGNDLSTLKVLAEIGVDLTKGWQGIYGKTTPYEYIVNRKRVDMQKFRDSLFISDLENYLKNNASNSNRLFTPSLTDCMAVNKLLKLIKDDVKVQTDFTEEELDALYDGQLKNILKRHKDCFHVMCNYIHEVENQNPAQDKTGKSNKT